MVIDIKMCRFDNVPWGFRLVGGSDFEFPLTVVKVSEASIAEEAGLRAGDVIVRVNDTATSPLTHDEVNNIIRHCGNVFYLGVQRESEDSEETSHHFPISDAQATESTTHSGFLLDSKSAGKSPDYTPKLSEERDYVVEEPAESERSNSVLSENTERKIVEDEIAAVLSGESEVLKEHNVMGILPKPGVCMSSDVLRSLNEEAIKTKAEKDKENRKWTTFLQKPNRPIPKSKAQIEAEQRAANAYKIQIIKSGPRLTFDEKKFAPKKIEPQESVAESAKTANDTTETEKENKSEENQKEEDMPELPTPTDSEVPSLEETPNEMPAKNETEAATEPTSELNGSTDENEMQEDGTTGNSESLGEKGADAEEVKVEEPPKPVKTEEELALERQLADVQRQLVALSSLPSTIQSTLDAVTKQLAELLPAFKLQQQNNKATRSLQLVQIDEEGQEATKDETESTKETVECVQAAANATQRDEESNKESESTSLDDNSSNVTAIEVDPTDANDEEVATLNITPKSAAPAQIINHHGDEEQEKLKKPKRHEVIEELEEHLDRKKNPKRSKRAFGPLTPSSERPVVLPGGRRWYRPKDAYNDEFIAEILSSQAELITGQTLGSNYESPFLGYDSRVNFMKYQKPDRKIDLNRSEVYKIIHHLDRKPVRGIEIRPSLVAAESDIKEALQS